MRYSPLRLGFLAALTFATSTELLLAQPTAWLVDDDTTHGVPDFATIQEAVDAATDHDLILVGSGSVGSFIVEQKSLNIAVFAGDSATTSAFSPIRIHNLTATQTVTLEGFTNSGNTDLYLNDNAGQVYIKSSEFDEVSINNSKTVTLNGIVSHDRTFVADSALYAYESTFAPDSSDLSTYYGIEIEQDSLVYLAGCTLIGADGAYAIQEHHPPSCICLSPVGAACDFQCFDQFPIGGGCSCFSAGPPRAALKVDTGSVAFVLDSEFSAGSGGTACPECNPFFSSCCDPITPYPPAPLVELVADGAIHYFTGEQHMFEMTDQLEPGGVLDMFFSGVPGEHVFVLASLHLDPVFYWALQGPITIAQPWVLIPVGIIPDTGVLQFSHRINPKLLTQHAYVQLFAQGIFVNPSQMGSDYMSTTDRTLIIDP